MIVFYFLVSILPLAKHPLWGDRFGDMTVIKYVGLLSLAYAIVHFFVRPSSPQFLRTRTARAFLLFYGLVTLNYFAWGQEFSFAMDPFISYTSFLMFFVVTLILIDSLPRLRMAMLVAIGSIALASVYLIREWQKYGGTMRPGWIVGDANYFTASALLCLPVAYYLMQRQSPTWVRVFCLGSTCLTLFAVMLGASRGGFLGLLTASLFIVWRSRQRMRNLALVAAILIPLSIISPQSPISRLLRPNHLDTRSVEARTSVWAAGMQMFIARPVTGIGLGNFKAMVAMFAGFGLIDDAFADGTMAHVAHNTYLEILAEMGIFGLLAFLFLLWSAVRTLEDIHRDAAATGPPLLDHCALGLQAGILGFCVAAFFISAQFQKLFWFMLFVSMALPALAADIKRRTAVAPAPTRGGTRPGLWPVWRPQ